MVDIIPLKLQQFSLADKIKAAHTGELAVIILQIKHRISVLFIAEYDMINIPCYSLHRFPFSPYTLVIPPDSRKGVRLLCTPLSNHLLCSAYGMNIL